MLKLGNGESRDPVLLLALIDEKPKLQPDYSVRCLPARFPIYRGHVGMDSQAFFILLSQETSWVLL